MKPVLGVLIIISLLFQVQNLHAESSTVENEILASRGKGVVTQVDFSARADKIPEDIRRETLRDRNRLRDVVNSMLLHAQLAADAREAGFDKDQIIIERMRLAADAELAIAWIDQYIAMQPGADYEKLAYENYQLNKDTYLSSPKLDVSHILISTSERSDTDAEVMANEIFLQVTEDPELFNELVLSHSEDPSASSNKGMFRNVNKGDMVKEFEDVAFAMEAGEISRPVKTDYGYHIIRVDNHIKSRQLGFDAVKLQLIDDEKKRHEDRIKLDYLGSLTSLDVQMTKEALEEMVSRLFGEDYTEAPGG